MTSFIALDCLSSPEWLKLNRQVLMTDVARIHQCLQRQAARNQGDPSEPLSNAVENTERSLQQLTAQLPYPSALQQLCEIFKLSAFERDILLLCAGAELSIGWGPLCAQAQGNLRLRAPTFELANLIAVCAPHWSAFSAASPLRFWRMIEVGAGDALMTSPLRVDERILRYLLGLAGLDTRLLKRMKRFGRSNVRADVVSSEEAFSTGLVPSHQAICDRIVHLWQQHSATASVTQTDRSSVLPVVQLWGSDIHIQRQIATAVAQITNATAYLLNFQQIPSDIDQHQMLVELWQRETKLSALVLILEGALTRESPHLPAFLQWVNTIETPLILIGSEAQKLKSRSTVSYEVRAPQREEQYQCWQQSLVELPFVTDTVLKTITDQFSLSAQQIKTAAVQLLSELPYEVSNEVSNELPNGSPDKLPTEETFKTHLWNICRVQSRPRLDDLAQRLTPKESWSDLILPELQTKTLEAMVACLRSQRKVYADWGFADKQSRGLGISALFSGISGTGKTMAALAIAQTLELDLYRIDLSSVVSKYIGETEKNLRQVFDAAEAGSVVLLFDEADALFGKRSDVRDSHDRYANMEVSYLLQRMESYQGLAILTTNLKESIDPAFMRRLRFIVKFPAPDFEQRCKIWQRVFPAQTPTKDLNYRKLAKLNVTGGLIRNIALTAAFIAADSTQSNADQEASVTMAHVLSATHSEYSKLERPVPAAEVKGWVVSKEKSTSR